MDLTIGSYVKVLEGTQDTSLVGLKGKIMSKRDSAGFCYISLDDRFNHKRNDGLFSVESWCLTPADGEVSFIKTNPNTLSISRDNFAYSHTPTRGNNMEELLGLYERKCISKLYQEYRDRARKRKEEHQAYKAMVKLGGSLASEFDKDKHKFKFELDLQDDLADEEYHSRKEQIEEKVQEVRVRLNICVTYEQKIEVLKAYNILDKKGKLNIE